MWQCPEYDDPKLSLFWIRVNNFADIEKEDHCWLEWLDEAVFKPNFFNIIKGFVGQLDHYLDF